MKHRHYYTTILFLFFYLFSFSQVLSEEEKKLYNKIMEYRKENGLPAIALSASLTKVAQLHCKDLADNIGYLTHSWSNCNYDAGNSKTYPCMWLKPSELTQYQGYGYECAHGGTGGYTATAATALESWKGSPGHNAVIFERRYLE